MNEQQYINALFEGFRLSNGDVEMLVSGLASSLFQESKQVRDLQQKIEEMDQVVSDSRGSVYVKCRSCQEYYDLPCDLSEFNRDYSYCGKNEFCCP
jgi:hypothetical protein